MIGGSKGSQANISQYLINFNAADWAKQANSFLQSAMTQGLAYSEKYSKDAVDTLQQAQQQSNQYQQQGYNTAQALNAPQRLATYGALDAYQDMLGLARPNAGSFQLAQAIANQQQNQATPEQNQLASSFNQGLLGPVQTPPYQGVS